MLTGSKSTNSNLFQSTSYLNVYLTDENVEKPKEVKKSSESDLKKVEKINKEFSDKSKDSQVEKLKKQQEIFQGNASSYNGAIRENYSWGQNINDIDIQVKVNL